MSHSEAAKENFRFLVAEVTRQVTQTQWEMQDPNERRREKIQTRDNYIDNLKGFVLNNTFRALLESKGLSRVEARQIQAMSVIAGNLENIADFCSNIMRQLGYLKDRSALERLQYPKMFQEILGALAKVERSLSTRDVDLALEICRVEFLLDQIYKVKFTGIMEDLRRGEDPENMVTILFILRYLERMGDCLLNIGEAIISAAVGERLKIHQFTALSDSLNRNALRDEATAVSSLADTGLSFENLAETKSGCRIGRVRTHPEDADAQWVLFKEGAAEKLRSEKRNLERWDSLVPGLPPRLLDFEERGESASLLLEFLPGATFQRAILDQPIEDVLTALTSITEVLEEIWTRTKKPNPVNAGFMDQLAVRMEDIIAMHATPDGGDQWIHHLPVPSLCSRLQRLRVLEKSQDAPFSVFIHGDFNTDNIVLNPDDHKVNFIDLHRSKDWDYVQDVSVFLVSVFRMPLLNAAMRTRLNRVARVFFHFARDFAKRNGDETMDIRLALGLIRSLVTSTRFVLVRALSKEMILRARYLMERVLDHEGRDWADFELPTDVLYY